MTIIRLQGYEEQERGIYYEYDADSKPLGEGAMGRVFKGHMVDERKKERTPIAIKAITPNIPPHVVERARREANVRIDSNNLLKMLGFVEMTFVMSIEERTVHQKRYFVVMELLEGVTLHDLMQGVITTPNGVTVAYAKQLRDSFITHKYETIKYIMGQVLQGVMALHNANYIHRDIDPSNIMVCSDGTIRLIDFGICKKIDALGTQDKNLTSSGVFMGKVNYAAPELVLGDVEHQNRSTDIYSLGILLYQLCAGHLPFTGDDNSVMLAHIRKPLHLKDVELRSFRQVVEKATKKSQSERYQLAIDMYEALKSANLTDSGGSKIAILLVVLGLAIGVALAYWFANREKDTHEEETQEEEVQEMDFQTIRINLWAKDRQTVYDAFQELQKMAGKQENIEAMFEYGLSFSVGNPDFTIPTDRQKMLDFEPDIERANLWMKRVLVKDPENYRATYWMLNNLIAKKQKNDDAIIADEIADLLKLFDKLTTDSSDNVARVYKRSVDQQRHWLSKWGIN